MCQSGRMGRTRNAVCPKGHQRFESSHLRQDNLVSCRPECPKIVKALSVPIDDLIKL